MLPEPRLNEIILKELITVERQKEGEGERHITEINKK